MSSHPGREASEHASENMALFWVWGQLMTEPRTNIMMPYPGIRASMDPSMPPLSGSAFTRIATSGNPAPILICSRQDTRPRQCTDVTEWSLVRPVYICAAHGSSWELSWCCCSGRTLLTKDADLARELAPAIGQPPGQQVPHDAPQQVPQRCPSPEQCSQRGSWHI